MGAEGNSERGRTEKIFEERGYGVGMKKRLEKARRSNMGGERDRGLNMGGGER